MSYEKQKTELKSLLLSGYPLIYIVSQDERPVIDVLKKIVQEIEREYELVSWDAIGKAFNEVSNKKFLKKFGKDAQGKRDKEKDEAYGSTSIIEYIRKSAQNSIVVMHDYHYNFEKGLNSNVMEKRRFKHFFLDTALPFTDEYKSEKYSLSGDDYFKHIIITSPVKQIPLELSKLFRIIEFGLPDKEEVNNIVESIKKSETHMYPLYKTEEEKEHIINAALGLTESQIFYAIKKSMYDNHGRVIPKDIYSLKQELVKESGSLEFIHTEDSLEDVAGFDNLMEWLKRKKVAFHDETREKYRLDVPKGMLLTGVQGCGKSFVAKGVSNFFDLPLIRLNYGNLAGRYLGESEQKLRNAIAMVEAVSPCVLWIDEIEKSAPNDNRSGTESMMRVFGQLITWMQEKTKPIFIVATANNVDYLPPELLRKGRFDEIFFVDLPTVKERKQILTIHLKKKGYEGETFDLVRLADATKGFSGAEIEQLISDSVLEAVYKGEQLTEVIIEKEAGKTKPLSITMEEKVSAIRKWAVQQQVRRVSTEEPESNKGKIGF